MYNELKYVSSRLQSNNTDCNINDNIMIIIIMMMISNGNRTEWSPIRSVIIRRVIKKHKHTNKHTQSI